jgi:VWFA-related protein
MPFHPSGSPLSAGLSHSPLRACGSVACRGFHRQPPGANAERANHSGRCSTSSICATRAAAIAREHATGRATRAAAGRSRHGSRRGRVSLPHHCERGQPDLHGQRPANLNQSDFALLDDQKAPAKVNSFHQQINLPLRVGIVIDASSSIRSRFKFEQQSATEFLLQVLRAKNDRAFVMGFAETPTVTTDWTNDQDALETGINKLSPGGGTALFDAVYVACRDKLLTERGPEPVRKAIILVSDGEDNQSRVYLPEAIKECERAETIIYAISTNWTPSRGEGDKVLQELAEQTGGEVFFPPSVEDMATSFKDIEEELRSQYALVYTPADFKTDGSFRTIYLYCYDRRYQVRARKGYFAPRE